MRRPPVSVPGPRTDGLVHDSSWAGEFRAAVGCSGLLLVLSLTVDGAHGTLNLLHAVLWIGLAVLLFVVLLPPRIAAGPGLLTVRGLFVRRWVRTDRLVSVRWVDGVSERLVLRDADGGRAELDPRVLVAQPRLWLLLEADARTSRNRGILRHGAGALERLARRIDKEAARSVFRVSGLDDV
ncbi:hypothetical protein ACGFMM_14950 [Streptomyces sp. NPDC048604]|uniref:hypothetical protein n=1 Tax=Streptomyces sp. NPDC048604 TaxID=3365578 RepID=UPI00371E7DB4